MNLQSLFTSARLVIVTMLVCVAGYTTAILELAQILTPETAEGGLVKSGTGQIVGSRLIAQAFTNTAYFWPRPSAVNYQADAAGGSNKSPTSSDLVDRAKQIIERYGASAQAPLPAELAAASGCGLDPHLTSRAAIYQATRVAKARGLTQSQVKALITRLTFSPGGLLTSDRLVNVLELNLALDEMGKE